MSTYRITLQPLTAFGTPLVGDTLFGQLCWTLRHLYGERQLEQLLHGYVHNEPFMVIGDAFPSAYIPLPILPSSYWNDASINDRKLFKAKRWLHNDHLHVQVAEWKNLALADNELAKTFNAGTVLTEHTQQHNRINRITGTTGTDSFAPFSQIQFWHHPQINLDVYVVLDEHRLTVEQFKTALQTVGHSGYGRDASIGLGKFEVIRLELHEWPVPEKVSHVMTLAPCALHGQGFSSLRSFYQIQTRFGRHGDVAALGATPFKQPLLMARSAAVLGYAESQQPPVLPAYVGQGIGNVSISQPDAVHQGYAPVIGIALEQELERAI